MSVNINSFFEVEKSSFPKWLNFALGYSGNGMISAQNKTGDNSLLVSIKKYFKDNGFDYFDWKEYCPELFANNDNLTKLKPTRKAIENLNKKIEVLNS